MAVRSALGLAAALFAAGAASAHHSPAAFDTTQEVFFDGTVAELEWKNPHIYLTLETTGAGGEPLLQEVEAAPVATVQTTGLAREHLAVGSHVVVRAHPNRRGPGRIVIGRDVTLDDGSIYPLNPGGRESRPTGALVPADSLAGKWTSTPEAFVRLAGMIRGGAWPLTDAARAAAADPTAVTAAAASCNIIATPPMLTVHQMLREIEVGDDQIVMRFDNLGVDTVRTIHLDAAEHPADLEPSSVGHSIGRWEGGTLVIDTVGFSPDSSGVGFGVPAGPGKHLVERLTLSEDGLHIAYELTLEEPEYLAEPVSFSAVWNHRPDLEFSSEAEACDPEISARFLE